MVGLRVDADARRQLRCIADAGRGTYDDADDAASLTVSLDRSSTRAARPFGFEGTAVEGTAEVDEDTPTIGTGSWVDELGGSGSPSDHRTYLVERTIPGSVPQAGHFPDGCVFRNRCAHATARCATRPPWTGDRGSGHACWHPVAGGGSG